MPKKSTYEELEKQIQELEQTESELKMADKALRESKEKYKTIIENIEDGYYEVDITGSFTFHNDSMCKILGYSKDELTGLNNRRYMDEENAKKVFKAFNRVYKTGQPYKAFDWELIRKDGSRCYVETSVSLTKDSKGHPIGFQGIARDITKRKQAEEALRKSEERFRNVHETAPLAFVVWDNNTCVTDWNKKAEEIFGWSKEEVVGYNFFDFLIPEKDRPQVEDVVNGLLKGDLLSHSINENLTKEGKIIICEWNNSALHDDDGNTIGAISLGLDITDRKQAEEALRESEEKYRRIYDNIIDVYYEASIDGIILEISSSIEKISKYKRKELIGKSLYDVYTNPEERNKLLEALINDGSVNEYELNLTDKDDTQRICSINSILIKDKNGNPIKLVGIMRDISDRK